MKLSELKIGNRVKIVENKDEYQGEIRYFFPQGHAVIVVVEGKERVVSPNDITHKIEEVATPIDKPVKFEFEAQINKSTISSINCTYSYRRLDFSSSYSHLGKIISIENVPDDNFRFDLNKKYKITIEEM